MHESASASRSVSCIRFPDLRYANNVHYVTKITILYCVTNSPLRDCRITSRNPFTFRIIKIQAMPTVFQQISWRVTTVMICIGQLIVLSPSLHSTSREINIQIDSFPFQSILPPKERIGAQLLGKPIGRSSIPLITPSLFTSL